MYSVSALVGNGVTVVCKVQSTAEAAISRERKDMKHIIWSNINLDIDDWRDDILEEHPDYSEDECYRVMVELNDMYLDDERLNLNKVVGPILVIADLGRWNGRFSGYKEIPSGNIADCLYCECDYMEWYVEDGDMRGIGIGRAHV